jgi:hypothetical protein
VCAHLRRCIGLCEESIDNSADARTRGRVTDSVRVFYASPDLYMQEPSEPPSAESPGGGDLNLDSDVAAAAPLTTARGLPSERARPGDPRPVGFQAEPTAEHVARSSAAIQAIAAQATMAAPTDARSLRVCFCHTRLAPRLPFNLYGFHLVGIDDGGNVRDSFADDYEIRYALIVNQPVSLQSEVAIRFLFDLVGRQGPLADVAAGRRTLADLPSLVATADAAAAQTAWDSLRLSLTHAMTTLQARARAAGYRLELRYEPDPLPTRASVAERVPALRMLYNNQADVRDAVDRTVTAVAIQRGEVRGGPEAVRALLQQQTALLGVRQFINQTIRDADVCGNGFLEFGFIGLDPRLRCLRPEDVEVLGGDNFNLDTASGPVNLSNHVLHMRGLQQLEAPYGISPWEPLLYVVQRAEISRNVRRFASQARRHGVTERQEMELASLERVVAASEQQVQQSLDTLLWYPRQGLPDIAEGLYFSGQERMR